MDDPKHSCLHISATCPGGETCRLAVTYTELDQRCLTKGMPHFSSLEGADRFHWLPEELDVHHTGLHDVLHLKSNTRKHHSTEGRRIGDSFYLVTVLSHDDRVKKGGRMST